MYNQFIGIVQNIDLKPTPKLTAAVQIMMYYNNMGAYIVHSSI